MPANIQNWNCISHVSSDLGWVPQAHYVYPQHCQRLRCVLVVDALKFGSIMRFVAPQTKHDDDDDDEAHPSVPKRTYVTGIELLSCGMWGELCEMYPNEEGVWEEIAVLSLPDAQQVALRNYLSNSHWPLTSNRQSDRETVRQIDGLILPPTRLNLAINQQLYDHSTNKFILFMIRTGLSQHPLN